MLGLWVVKEHQQQEITVDICSSKLQWIVVKEQLEPLQ